MHDGFAVHRLILMSVAHVFLLHLPSSFASFHLLYRTISHIPLPSAITAFLRGEGPVKGQPSPLTVITLTPGPKNRGETYYACISFYNGAPHARSISGQSFFCSHSPFGPNRGFDLYLMPSPFGRPIGTDLSTAPAFEPF